MNIEMTLSSASCDIQIASGHAKNRNLDGQKRCLDAAATRIDAVVDYAVGLGLVVPSRAMELMLNCMNGYDDYHDSSEMLSYFNSISGLPNAQKMGLI